MKPHEKLAKIRNVRGWTQQSFAEKLGMSVNAYANLELGKTNLANVHLQAAVGLLGITLAELFEEKELAGSSISLGDHNTYENNHISNVISASADIAVELKRLQVLNRHHEAMLKQKDVEIMHLNTILEMLREKILNV